MNKTLKIITCTSRRFIKKCKRVVSKTKKFIKTLPKRVDGILSRSLRSKRR